MFRTRICVFESRGGGGDASARVVWTNRLRRPFPIDTRLWAAETAKARFRSWAPARGPQVTGYGDNDAGCFQSGLRVRVRREGRKV